VTACDELRLDFPAWLRGELPDARAAELNRHVADCAQCGEDLAELREAIALAEMSPLEHEPPDGLEERTLAYVELERSATAGLKLSVDVRAMERVRARRKAAAASRATRVLAPALAALLLVVGFVAVRALSESDDLERRLERLRQSRPPGELLRTVTLTSARFSDVSATAKLSEGHEGNYLVELTTNDFPRCPKRHQYELWFGNEQERMWISAGSFKTTGLPFMTFRFHVGTNLEDYNLVDLTLEPSNGDPSRDGDVIMQSKFDSSGL
jgi:hypothetical protein